MPEQGTIYLGKKKREFLIGLFIFLAILCLGSLIAINFISMDYVVMAAVGLFIAFLAFYFTDFFFYAMVALYPFIGAQVIVGAINVPFVDMIGLIVFGVWMIKRIINLPNNKLTKKDFPGLLFAGLFFLSGALSLLNAEFFNASLKYLLRPIMFFYLIFVLLPYHFLNNKKKLEKVFKILFVVGVVVGILGILTVLFSSGPWYARRAAPFAILGVDLVGGNQNAIAEVMIISIPIALLLISKTKNSSLQGAYLVGLLFFSGILMLTVSRAGWLALLLEMIILFLFGFGAKVRKRFVLPLLLFFLILPLIFYFTIWQNMSLVQTSNESRIMLTEIALNNFVNHPFIGHGNGSYLDIVSQTYVFFVDFGDPLDSHGFIQKIILEQGLLGVVAFFGFLTYIFYIQVQSYLVEKNKQERFILMCLIMMSAGILFFQLFSTSYYLARVWVPVGIGLAVAKVYLGNNRKNTKSKILAE